MSHTEILRDVPSDMEGLCDVFVRTDRAYPRILQLTDMQIIDAEGRRTPDRISEEKISLWSPERMDANYFSHVRDLVAQSEPDLILLTGDIVYGEFDDTGRVLRRLIAEMDSLGIPWAPVFGNHDNEAKIGVEAQCALLEAGKNCLFRRGNTVGYGNYTVGILSGDRLCRVLYLLDSHGCRNSSEEAVKSLSTGIHEEQGQWMENVAKRLRERFGASVPGFAAYHIPTREFVEASVAAGYGDEHATYTLGADLPARAGDFGGKWERMKGYPSPDRFAERLLAMNVRGVFVGHCHCIQTSIGYKGIRWTFGLKTGIYDYYSNGQLGGTLIEERGAGDFSVRHLPTLVTYPAPLPV